MNSQQIDWKEIFPLLKHMMADAFHTDSVLLTAPYNNIMMADRGMRQMVWKDFSIPFITSKAFTSDHYHLFIFRSTLGFTNLLAIVETGPAPAIVSIGPFCEEEISLSFIHRVAERNHLSNEFLSVIQDFYRTLPLLNAAQPLAMLRHFLGFYIPDFMDIKEDILDYSETQHDFVPDDGRINAFSTGFVKSYIHSLQDYLSAVAIGNTTAAADKLQGFKNQIFLPKDRPRTLKLYLHTLNTHIFHHLMNNNLPIDQLFALFHKMSLKIDECMQPQILATLSLEMTRKYCLLVQNYNCCDYTLPVRQTILFISEHLNEPLDLETLAEAVRVSPGHLSHRFHEETGKHLMNYIQKERMHAAIRLFNTSNLSVQEVASEVGIHDAAYFSRLFRKHIGQSPREYKKMLNRRQP